MSNSAEIDQCLAEIAYTEKQIAAAQKESADAAEVLRQAKAKEAVLSGTLSNLKFKVCSLLLYVLVLIYFDAGEPAARCGGAAAD
jgi:hypothetical protein